MAKCLSNMLNKKMNSASQFSNTPRYDFEFPAIPFLTDTAGNRLQVCTDG